MKLTLTQKQLNRFWSRTTLDTVSGCINWNTDNVKRYGRISINGNHILAHRLAWIIAYEEVPDDLDVLHHCDNPACVNVQHLFLGTHFDNMRDMYNKNRRKSAHGESHGSAKLTAVQVSEIRQLLKAGENRQRIANLFGITIRMVFYIQAQHNWKET